MATNTVSLDLEHFHDDLPEEGDEPEWLVDAIEAFNRAVEGKTVSWRAIDVAAVVPAEVKP